mmetsp:Transcript_2609/g.5657  ORF Transcript_2609/g.5657 Transcript_2609/m.5657 type:complete len:265 (-) Transcript_2609:39-833(-)
MATFGRHQQRSRAVDGPCSIHPRPRPQQQPDTLRVPRLASLAEGSQTVRPGGIDGSLVLQQRAYDFGVPLVASGKQRGASILEVRVDARARVQQHAHQLCSARLRCHQQRGHSVVTPRLHVRACSDERADHVHVPFVGGSVEGCGAIAHRDVNVRTGRQKELHVPQVASVGRHDKRGHAVAAPRLNARPVSNQLAQDVGAVMVGGDEEGGGSVLQSGLYVRASLQHLDNNGRVAVADGKEEGSLCSHPPREHLHLILIEALVNV